MIDYHLVRKTFLNNEFTKLLTKYAVILSIMLLLRTGTYVIVPMLSWVFDVDAYTYYQSAITISIYALNIVSAILVYLDMSRLNVMSWSIILLTAVSNEVGICFFLIFVLYQTLQQETSEQAL